MTCRCAGQALHANAMAMHASCVQPPRQVKAWTCTLPVRHTRRQLQRQRMRHAAHSMWGQPSSSNAAGGNGSPGATVSVVIDRGHRNSRRLYANVEIAAPPQVVWDALTDYEGLGTFIPGLAENRCLHRHANGCTLLQVGEQDVAFGAKFRARVVLDIQEHSRGAPRERCATFAEYDPDDAAREMLFPLPRCPQNQPDFRDISFTMVDGDFQAFKGIWRMQQGLHGPSCTTLSYSVFVRPQIWLPVRLIQSRIEGEIRANLSAVRQHSELVQRQQNKAPTR